jgi:ATP phosphoribosyltransferase
MRKLKVVVPKGRIYGNVVKLIADAGITLQTNDRVYRPCVSDSELEVKIMKPQNIPKLVELGSHDVGFTGHDWVIETGADVVEVMDLKLDPVKIIVAAPRTLLSENLFKRQIVVASEYEKIAREFLQKEGYNSVFLRTYGATEVFPPDDADMIIDNTTTGTTLREHDLCVISTILESSTRFIANREALTEQWKSQKIQEMKMVFQAILDARERVLLEMNVPKEKFEEIIRILPCMRSPTVAPLYGERGYAVKVAVKKKEVARLIPLLKKLGATDILEYEMRKVVI